MSSTKKTILILLSSITLVIIIFYAFVFYRQMKEPVSPAINAIPLNASIIFETKKITEIRSKLSLDNDLWKELLNIDAVRILEKQIQQIDSIISGDSRASKIIHEQPFYISVHTSTLNKTNALFILGLPNNRERSYINKFIKEALHDGCLVSIYEFRGVEICKSQIAGDKPSFYHTVYKGVFICSFDETLVETAINQLNSKTVITDDISFQKLRHTSGKKVDANIYINFQNVFRTIKNFSGEDTKEFIKPMQEIAQWTETDLLIKKDELLLNGFTSVSENDNRNYLKIFNDQSPQTISTTAFMPYNTIFFINYGFDDFPGFNNSYKSYLESNKLLDSYNEDVNSVNNKFNIKADKSFISWVGNEIALIITDPGKGKIPSNTYVVVNVNNIDTAAKELESLSESIQKKTNAASFTKNYNDHIIRQIAIPNILSTLFGKTFEGVESNYYVLFGNYVIFANEVSSLIRYLGALQMKKTLTKNENYIEFSDNISEKSNIFMYCNLRKSLNMIRKNSNKELAHIIEKHSSVFKNFEAFSVQFSSNSQLFYTNIYLKYNPFYTEEKSSLWEVNLDAAIIGKPHLIKDHTDNSKKIIAFDINNNMYLIDQEGSLIWKIRLAENIISDVYQVDYYKNGKIQYLFNTKNYIYLIDLKGNKLPDYPVKLPGEATNGIALFDYNKEKDYRILVACDNNRIYNFNLKGKQVKGWKMKKTSAGVSKTIKHITSAKKDYIITTEDNGKIHITDRKGFDRIKTGKYTNNSLNSDIYLNKTNSRGIFLTTNNDGDLIYISKGSKIKKTEFGNFSKDHFFLYEDINNDGSIDFIFLDKNKLVIFDRFKKLLLDHSFENNIEIKPVFIRLNKNTSLLGVVDSQSEKIILFDKDGVIESGVDLIGGTDFIIEKTGKTGEKFLITASGNTIFKYDILQ